MSTRASISKVNPDGTITSIYSHWDGYPAHVGKLLLEHYNSDEAIDQLLALGDVSALYESIAKPEGHTFETPVAGHTIFYGRDRGETGVDAKVSDTKTDFENYWHNSWCEYFYQYRNGKWYYGTSEKSINSPLTAKVVERD